jgi:polysaccharide deacetylase family sporulation protein PdaB
VKGNRSLKIATASGVAAIALAVIFALQTTGAYAVFFGETVRSLPIYSVERSDKKIAITFDCAWGVDYTEKLLDALQANNAAATFFMVQFWTEKYPEYVKKIDEAGCEIGTHSATHSYMSKQNEEEIKQELTSSATAITAVTGKKVELFRAPYGDYDDLLIDTATALGYYTIQWDVDSLDWKDLSATDIALRIVNGVTDGSIILCHNNGLHTAEALPLVLSTLQNKGYTFVTVGELIYRENYTINSAGRQIPNQTA